MPAPDRQQSLAALRHAIADIERKPALAGPAEQPRNSPGLFPLLPGGLVQDIYADGPGDGGASLAFALAQAKTLLSARRPAIFYLQLANDGQVFGLPYAPGLAWFGLDPAQLVVVRAADMSDFLWATEEAAASGAVAAVVAEVKGEPALLNFTASRRLNLRTGAGGASLFLLRYGRHRQSSAAHLRWRLLPRQSGRHPFDTRAPGPARWRLTLEKGRIAGAQMDWMLELKTNGLALLPAEPADAGRPHAQPPLPGALPALLGHRLSQAG